MTQTAHPRGWKAQIGWLLLALTPLALVAWIWLADWRWGATAGVLAVTGLGWLAAAAGPRPARARPPGKVPPPPPPPEPPARQFPPPPYSD